ncbi:leptomycin B resistance protein pmd1 [Microthyrium microscopicum]|uniref:Leptomycin B resistance protein pmd1 n=1 Tax=Microthyrium microscopicum TaxID=703497 RepID=A0A6A6U8C6_9PEZI|nr:leptomycin B resistance protein pmd1 [Microthyrium microscopicum]
MSDPKDGVITPSLDQNPEKAPVMVKEVKKTRKQKQQEAKEAKEKTLAELPPGSKQGVWSNFIRILSFGDKIDYLLMGACFFTAIGSGVAMPLMMVVFGRLVGNFTGYFTAGTNVTYNQFLHQVTQNTLYMVYIGIARFGLSYISLFTVRMSGLRISAKIRLAYLRKLLEMPVSVIDATSPGKISSRLTTNANTIQMGVSQQLAMLVQALSFTIGLYVVSFIKGPLLTLVASSPLPLALFIYAMVLPVIFKKSKVSEEFKEKASALAFEIFESVRIVNAFSAQDRLWNAHGGYINQALKLDVQQGPLLGLMMSPFYFSVYGTFALTFWFGLRQYSHGHIDGVGSITVVLFSVQFAVTMLGRIFTPIMGIMKAATAAMEIFITLDTPIEDMSGLKDPDVSATEDIIFKDVTFAYPTRQDKVILDKLCLTFERGKTTAIVGPSGSGKSTIVGLILRWYKPTSPAVSEAAAKAKEAEAKAASEKKNLAEGKITEHSIVKDNPKEDKGEKTKSDTGAVINSGPGDSSGDDTGTILVGDVELHSIDAKWWRSNVGLVAQEPFLFNDTIYNNVANGLTGTKWEDSPKEEKMEMVKIACQEAYADEFISRLPLGYETQVGEHGIKISGGQRQRISIARAIIKQPPILILDEATSAIDVRAELIVQKALDRVSENRTTISIAHRLSTIKRADKIVVCRAGTVIEQGTHSQLVEDQDGVYSGLVRAQKLEMGDDEFEKGDQADDQEQLLKVQSEPAKEKEETPISIEETGWKERGVIRSFGLLILEQRHRWFLYTVMLIACALNGAAYPIQAWLFGHLVQVFTLTGSELVTRGNFWSLMFFVLALVVLFAYFFMGWAAHLISVNVSSHYRQEYLRNILRKRIAWFDKDSSSAGSLTSLLSTDSMRLQELLGTNLGMTLISIFNLVGSIIISFYFGWKLALVGVLTIMPVVLLAGYYRLKLETQFVKLSSAVFEESSQFGTEAVAAFRTVTSLQLEDKIIRRFDELLATHVRTAYKKARWSTIVFAFSDSAEMFCQALCFYYGGTLLGKKEYEIVTFFVIYMAAIQGAQAAGMWFSFAPNIVEATAAANRILSVRPTQEEQDDNPPTMPESHEPIGLTLDSVNFSYAGRDIPVINNLSLKIAPGQFAALVGATGCGKSTIISLIERFYDPTGGKILLGDTDITTVDVASYRRNLSLVAQEATLYEGTIRENVALSVDAATDAEIEEACRSAQIHEFISSLSDGYATVIGPRGIALSGGQRQRVALARALLRKPQLLLLDEATSNLDSESEKLVQEAIEKAAGEGGRTVIAVAHRLATIQNADVIFVLGSGRLLESGTHLQLLAQRGVYFQMCQAQALDR